MTHWFTLDGEPIPESREITGGFRNARWATVPGAHFDRMTGVATFPDGRTLEIGPLVTFVTTVAERRTTAEIEAEIEAARPPELALGRHAYPLDDYPGWTREEDRWRSRWVFRRVADGYTFTDDAPTTHDIEEGIACAPPIEAP